MLTIFATIYTMMTSNLTLKEAFKTAVDEVTKPVLFGLGCCVFLAIDLSILYYLFEMLLGLK